MKIDKVEKTGEVIEVKKKSIIVTPYGRLILNVGDRYSLKDGLLVVYPARMFKKSNDIENVEK